MNIINSLRSGIYRAIKAWKGVLLTWLVLLILVSFVIIPLRGGLKSAFGSSMITDKLANGFNLEVYMDLGPVLKSLVSSLSSGFLFVLLIGFAANAFLTGGLFGSLRKDNTRFSSAEFFRSGASNFWSFLIISAIISGIILFLLFVVLGIQFIIVNSSETMSEKTAFIIGTVAVIILALLIPVLLTAADYARAKKASDEMMSWSRSLGSGFRMTFRKFWTSYLLIMLLMICQVILGLVAIGIVPGWQPAGGAGVFLLLIVSQFLVYSRLMLKTWRYASFTAMMEETEANRMTNL